MAVESIITREFTSASDVWAYGVILWKIGTLGGFPFPSILNVDLLPLLKQGYRMEKPDNCSTEVYDIMLQCWLEEPSKRPTFAQLRARFDSMLLAEKKDTYIDLQIDASKPYYQAEWSDSKETDEKPSKWGSQDSIKSLLNASSEMIPASFDPPTNCSPMVQLHGQRSLQSLSPGTDNDKAQRPVSLQLLSDRRNINNYVDDPFTRKSIVFDPPEPDPEHQRQVSQDDEPDGMNWNEGGGGKRGGEESSDGRGGGRAEGGRDYVAGGLGGGGSLEGGEGSGGGGGGGSDEENEGGEGVAGDGGGGEDGSGGGGGSGGGRRGFGVEKCDGEANTQNEVTDEQDVNIVPVFVISFS